MRDCVASKLRLPNLKRILINNISDEDAELSSFLSYCIPTQLELLNVNCLTNSKAWIKSEFYVDAFSGAAARTTKEVYFTFINFSAEDLQTIVRAAHKTERIIFNSCSIHCSSGLDFGADLSYKTKYLSFQGWGSKSVFKTTDWKADPSKFSLIVDAIGSSGLRASLEKLNIYYNDTLIQFKVQEELNVKGMSHISVFKRYNSELKY